ncbi:MAG: SDR family NAD(P)-dependent oxidoreductase [Pseudonocardiaceae bacterium]
MSGTSSSFSPHGRAVMITGASSGLGRETALHLERLGYTVFAGVRRAEDGEALAVESSRGGIRPVRIDLTDEDSVYGAAREVAEATADTGLWGLVNNAGICVIGPLELLPAARLRAALETNVIGHHTLTRGLLPSLRRTRGRIVNVSSGFGRVACPFYGGYAVTQFGKEGLSDALRRELRPFGIGVAVVEPGAIATPILGKLATEAQRVLAAAAPEIAELYRARFLGFLHMNEHRAHWLGTSPARCARAVEHALGARRPRIRYAVGLDWQLVRPVYRAFPDRMIDAVFGAQSDGMASRDPARDGTVPRPLGPAERWYRLGQLLRTLTSLVCHDAAPAGTASPVSGRSRSPSDARG